MHDEMIEDALSRSIGAWLSHPSAYFYEADIQSLLYHHLRVVADERGMVWNCGSVDGQTFWPGWTGREVSPRGLVTVQNRCFGTRAVPDLVVWGPSVRAAEHSSGPPVAFAAIEAKTSFPSRGVYDDRAWNAMDDDVHKLRGLVREGRVGLGIALMFMGLPGGARVDVFDRARAVAGSEGVLSVRILSGCPAPPFRLSQARG